MSVLPLRCVGKRKFGSVISLELVVAGTSSFTTRELRVTFSCSSCWRVCRSYCQVTHEFGFEFTIICVIDFFAILNAGGDQECANCNSAVSSFSFESFGSSKTRTHIAASQENCSVYLGGRMSRTLESRRSSGQYKERETIVKRFRRRIVVA